MPAMADFHDVMTRLGPKVTAQGTGNADTLRMLERQARRGWQDFLALSTTRYDRARAGEDTEDHVRLLLVKEQDLDRLDAAIRRETARLERPT
jgi:hypothetical protein